MSCTNITTCFRIGTDYKDRLITPTDGLGGLSDFRYEIKNQLGGLVKNLTVGAGLEIVGDKIVIQGDALEDLTVGKYDAIFWLDINGQTRDLFSEQLEISADKCDCQNLYNLAFTIIPVDITENVVNIYLNWEDLTPEQIEVLQQPAIDAAVIANEAANTANTAAGNANDAADAANQAANSVNEAISNAETATQNANDATQNANDAANLANQRAGEADTAAQNAQEAANTATQTNTDVQEAESLRVSAENTRISNENTRIGNENDRQTWEQERDDNEDERILNEVDRESAENSRNNAETTRQTNETGRVNAESSRVTAESARVTAENQRQAASSTAVTNANNAATAANTAATNADNARLAITDYGQAPFKTLRTGAAGQVTVSPTTSYMTYHLTVTDNVLINIDLQRMLNQVGAARFRLIIDLPILKTITFAKPILWGGTVPTFATAGQYVFEVQDVDGSNTPLIWQVASTLKAAATGVILYVDSATANYTAAQINGETATRTSNSWLNPFRYLQNAINAAQAGDVIFVKAGTYYPTHLRNSATYAAGDHQNKLANFTMKTGVDVYGGFAGTESRTWQRQTNSSGRMVNLSILSGDILREAVIDNAITIGDRRTAGSKANASDIVVYANVTSYTYLNGFDIIHGNSTGNGGAVNSLNNNLVNVNNRSYNNTAVSGGGWAYGINTNCTAYNNTAANGGGWAIGINTNCTAYNNTATTNGGGWYGGTNTNCTAYNNTSLNGGGWREGTNTNCTAYNNTSLNGGGWFYGTSTNCSAVNNIANNAVFIHPTSLGTTNVNCLLFGNRNSSNVLVGFTNSTAADLRFRNNAYDTVHPAISGGTDVNLASCIQNITLAQAKIEVTTFVGNATTQAQRDELATYTATITTKQKPKAGSVLKGAGINNATYPNPTDFVGKPRPTNSTIGILEGL